MDISHIEMAIMICMKYGMMEKVRQSIQGITLRMDHLKSIVILMITIGKIMRMEKESSPMSPCRQTRNTGRHLKVEIRNQGIHLCGAMKKSDGGAQESY